MIFILNSCSRERAPKPVTQRKPIAKKGPVSKGKNTPPEIRSVRIIPETPTASDDLQLKVDCRDAESVNCIISVTWFINGEPVESVSGYYLSKVLTKKGDEVKVKVIARDRDGTETTKITEGIVIANSPPRVTGYRFEPGNPSVESTIKILPRGEDPDGDEVFYKYEWFKNGEPLDVAEENVLPPHNVKPGDEITVNITPSDGDDDGNTVTAGPIEIINNPPRLVSPVPSQLTSYGSIHLPIKAVDPEGEKVTYTLEGDVPPGMSINSETGVITWDTTKAPEGQTYNITVKVSDPEGQSISTQITLTSPTKIQK